MREKIAGAVLGLMLLGLLAVEELIERRRRRRRKKEGNRGS